MEKRRSRRELIKAAGIGAGVAASSNLLHPALAANWQKIGGSITTPAGLRQAPMGRPQRKNIAGGFIFSAAVRSDGYVFAAGWNSYGSLANNGTGGSLSSGVEEMDTDNLELIQQ
jgi:alpha-tubulin suppressor-like RCC1 family protein